VKQIGVIQASIKGFPYPRGKVIGGCSTVNALAYM